MEPMQQASSDAAPRSRRALAAIPAGDARERVLSRLVSDVYGESPPLLRARVLECLLLPVGPFGLVAVAAGAFGSFLHRESWGRLHVSIDDTLRFSAEQVFELARFVDQVRPEALGQLASLVADNPLCLATLSGSVLLMALRLWVPAGPSDSDGDRDGGHDGDGDA